MNKVNGKEALPEPLVYTVEEAAAGPQNQHKIGEKAAQAGVSDRLKSSAENPDSPPAN
jgi:hypothetical protein